MSKLRAQVAALKKQLKRQEALAFLRKFKEPEPCISCGRIVLAGRCCNGPRTWEERYKILARGCTDNGCEVVEEADDGTGPWVINHPRAQLEHVVEALGFRPGTKLEDVPGEVKKLNQMFRDQTEDYGNALERERLALRRVGEFEWRFKQMLVDLDGVSEPALKIAMDVYKKLEIRPCTGEFLSCVFGCHDERCHNYIPPT